MTTEIKGNGGASLFLLSRLIGAIAAAATKNNSGTRIAHNRPGAAGVIAANITATTQRKAISLRTENMVPTYCPMIHLEQCSLDTGCWASSRTGIGDRQCGKADTPQQVLETRVVPQAVHAGIYVKIDKPVRVLFVGFLQVFNRAVVFSQSDVDSGKEVGCHILLLC